MPIDVVQVNSGGFNATSGPATLPVGTTAGNVVMIFTGSYSLSPTTITGLTKLTTNAATNTQLTAFRQTAASVGGETSWTVTITPVAQPVAWVVVELAGADATALVDVQVAAILSTTTGTTFSTGTTPTTSTYDGLAIAVHADTVAGTTPPTVSGQTGGFTEIANQGQAGTSNSTRLAISTQLVQQITTYASTATSSNTLSSANGGLGWAVVINATGAKKAVNVTVMAGMEWGTVAGLTTGTAPIFNASGGTPAIVTSTPRTGSYCLELSAAAAAEWVNWTAAGALSPGGPVLVGRFAFHFPASLPAGDVVLAVGGQVVIRYVSASQKIGVKVSTGTERLSDTTVTADTWLAIDFREDHRATTWACDWQLDYGDGVPVAQTQATLAGQTAGFPVGDMYWGWTAASTATVRYDDLVCSLTYGHYLLGDIRIQPLKVDPAGTVTLSGTTANFQTFAGATPTYTAWNATTARDALTELPPDITTGGRAGWAQITTAASDYVELPMETYDAVANNSAVRAVRMYACGWAASTTASTLGFRGWDGTTEVTLHAGTIDHQFDNSTTTPAWATKMFKPAAGWTPARLDALAFRVGFSSSAAQKPGPHGLYAEVATQPNDTAGVFGDASTGRAILESATDPVTGGIEALTLTTTDRPASLTYEESGTPTTVDVPRDTVQVEETDAADASVVNWVELDYSPEGVADT